MKKFAFITHSLSVALFCSNSFAWHPDFFNVSNENSTLTVRTTVSNHTYPAAGIKILSAEFALSNPGKECIPLSNGYCSFSVSDTNAKKIHFSGPPGMMKFILCLDANGPLSCQNYEIKQSISCDQVGGKIVSGSDACWINKQVTNPSTVPRCSSVCSAVGLTLQDPGPVNSSILAGNVCSAYGFTGTPKESGNTTFIGHGDDGPSNSCVWEDITSTNWDNPNNINFQKTGYYFCPCTLPI